jgi:FixJ family two-component response regulator
VDDDRAVRGKLERLVGETELGLRAFPTAAEFLEAYEPGAPACLLLEVALRDMSGLDLQAELRRRGLEIATVFLSLRTDVRTVVRAMQQGAFDFLEKPITDRALLDCVRRAIEHDRALRARDAEGAARRRALGTLSRRECEVMELLVEGKANKQIADVLGLRVRTVEGHRARVMAKLQAASLTDLVRITLATESPRRGA